MLPSIDELPPWEEAARGGVLNIRETQPATTPWWPDERARALRPMAVQAEALGLSFIATPERRGVTARPDPNAPDPSSPEGFQHLAAAIRDGRATLGEADGRSLLLLAPRPEDLPALAARIEASPTLGSRIVVTTPAAIRRLLVHANRKLIALDAVTRLWRARPDLSARRLATPLQIAVIAALLAVAGLAVALAGWTAVAVIDLFAGLLFLAIVVMRMQAISLVAAHARRPPVEPAPLEGEELPVYSVLLPLHDEPHMVGELVAAMERLEWPRDRLDIKLILEADDRRTLAAVAALRLGPPFEVIRVPRFGPRTKPKALAFALPLARGDYVTVYDAEDRPDPLQLLEAHRTFSSAGPELACLQSPLLVDNASANGLTALYGLEYSVQFDGVLPLLAAHDLPLPLGGTSNHFRRAALMRIGGWDPYNVTEDADLGIRLARFGYRSATLDRPTLEEAPRSARIWLRQRGRWLKGWMQTFLVHMRAPRRLIREIGPQRFAAFVLTSLGSVVAAAVHPIYLATAIAMLIQPALLFRMDSPALAAMTFLHLFNLVAAYGVFALLSAKTYRLRRQVRPTGALLYLPAYWLLLSLACYRALVELLFAPHHWAKTPHVGRRGGKPRKAAVPATR